MSFVGAGNSTSDAGGTVCVWAAHAESTSNASPATTPVTARENSVMVTPVDVRGQEHYAASRFDV